MQTVSTSFQAQSGGNSTLSYLNYGVQISWLKTSNPSYQFFTIGTSLIGGPDFIPSASMTAPSYLNQYQYVDYSAYALRWSVTRNIGQYPYGAFATQASVQLDNTSLLFLPGYDPTIGNFITYGRPILLSAGFGSETINIYAGLTTQPQNNISDRTISLNSFDGMDYLNLFSSNAAGPLAVAGNGSYVNTYAHLIIQDLLIEAGLSTPQFVLEQSLQQPIGYFSPYNLVIGQIIQALCEAEQGLFFFDENGIARFWNRQHIANNQTSQWTFDETSAVQILPEDTPVLNDIVVQGNPRAVQAKQQIWQLTSSTTVPAPVSTTILTNYSTNPSFENDTTNWTVPGGGTLTRITTDAWTGSACGSLVSTGSTQYADNTITVTTNTPYVAQCHVKGTVGVVVTISAVENGVTLASNTVTLDGNWDLLSLPTFTTDGTHTSMDIRIAPTTSTTIKIDGVMIQKTAVASSTYFDGNTTYTTSYVYSWVGTGNDSASIGTPCGSVTIEADFEDDDGSLPVTSVDLPVYYTATTLDSNYVANLNSDGSGLDAGAYVFVGGTSLTNTPSTAATLSGSSYFITFLNIYSQPLYITQLNLYGTPAKVTYQINVEAQNSSSIALYGTNPANNGQPLTIQNDLIQNPTTAQSNAIQLITDYDTPYRRVVADVFAVPQLQIGDTVTLGINDITTNQNTPIGILSSITHNIPLPQYTEYVVVGKTDTSAPDALLEQQLELEVKILAHYFTIGVSVIGGTDQIAPG